MPRHGDGGDDSANNSLSAPPDAPSTEQYQPVYSPHSHHHHQTAQHLSSPAKMRDAPHSAGRSTADLDTYHARATSFASETDGHDEDEDTLTMPVPSSQPPRRVTPPPAPQHQQPQQQELRVQQQQRPAVSPPRSPNPPVGKKVLVMAGPPPRGASPPLRSVVSPPRTAAPPSAPPARYVPVGGVQQPQPHLVPVSSAPRTPPPPPPPPQQQQQLQHSLHPVATGTAPPPAGLRAVPPRPALVDSSGFHYSTKAAAPAAPAHVLTGTPPHTMAPTPVSVFQQQQQQRRSPQRQAAAHDTLLLPPQLDHLTSSPPPAPAQAAAAQWQLSSPQDSRRRDVLAAPGTYHHHTNNSSSDSRGAVFEYASEAVNTLEQQYGDALQRLGTMHRLYDRLDEQNQTLEAEVVRLRRVNEVLQNGVAFSVYNSVRQVKHELKLLKQYVEVLCTGFSHSMAALQQVVAEDVPRIMGRDSAYTSLLPFGAQGRLRPMDTRVSVSHGATPYDHLKSSHAAGVAEGQVYRPEYWWNAMSPQPLRPPTDGDANVTDAETDNDAFPQQQQQQQYWQSPGEVVEVTHDPYNSAAAAENALVCVDNNVEANNSHPCDAHTSHAPVTHAEASSPHQAVPFHTFREVQTALAEAQRRVVELEQRTSHQQADFDDRVAQLKIAHRAREARLEEELAVWKRASLTIGDNENGGGSDVDARSRGGTREGETLNAVSAVTVDVDTLAKLLARLQPPNASAMAATAKVHPRQPRGHHPVDFSSPSRDVLVEDHVSHRGGHGRFHNDNDEDFDSMHGDRYDGMVDSRDPASTAGDEERDSRLDNDDDEDVLSGNAEESSEDAAYNYYYGSGDVRNSYDRTQRRVVQTTALGHSSDRVPTVSGDDGRLHVPDRFSPAEAARRVEKARRALQERPDTTTTTSTAKKALTRATGGNGGVSLAYDRLLGHRDDGPKLATSASSARFNDPRDGRYQAEIQRQQQQPQRQASRSVKRKAPRSSSSSNAANVRRRDGGGDLRSVDPALVQAVLEQLSHQTHSGNQRYAVKHERGTAATAADARGTSKVDRVAQGLWAQEMLKERSYI